MDQCIVKAMIRSKARCFERIDGRVYMISFAPSGEVAVGGLVFYSGDTLRVMPVCQIPYAELLRVVETSQLSKDENNNAMVVESMGVLD